MHSKVSEKGQLTIPKSVRDALGIRPGEVLDIREEAGRIVATKVTTADPLDECFGILDLGRATDEFIEEIRGSEVER